MPASQDKKKKTSGDKPAAKPSPDGKAPDAKPVSPKAKSVKGAKKPPAGRGAKGKGGEDGGVDVDPPADEDPVDLVDDDDDDDDDDATPAVIAPRPPMPRSQSNRPPSARDEPPPPFDIGERIILTSNVRPRTGAPIADHQVGAAGRVETVLSQTAIIRFDSAPERREVVAFTSLESTDPEAQARRKAEAKALAKAKKAAEAEAAQSAP